MYFSLARNGYLRAMPALATTCIADIPSSVRVCVIRRFLVSEGGGQLLLSQKFTSSVHCVFAPRGTPCTGENAAIAYLRSTKDAEGKPAAQFLERVPSVIFRSALTPSEQMGLSIMEATAAIDLEEDKEIDNEIDHSSETPEVFPANVALNESSWIIPWFVKRMKINDTGTMRVKTNIATHEVFVSSMKRRIASYYKAQRELKEMLEKPQIEDSSRVIDPVRLAAVNAQLEDGSADPSQFARQQDIDKKRKEIADTLSGIQNTVDTFTSVTIALDLPQALARGDSIIAAAVYGVTGSDTDRVSDEARRMFLVHIENAVNEAAAAVIKANDINR